MINFQKHLILFLSLLVLFCSKQEKSAPPKTSEMIFEVDSTRLESALYVPELGIRFSSPKGWLPISEALFKEFRQKNPTVPGDSVFLCKPVSIFFNNDSKSLLYISEIKTPNDSGSPGNYQSLIQKSLEPKKTGNFTKDNIYFTQFLIQDPVRINFKLVFSNANNQLIQFDYVVPTEFYVSELKAIESSIGSIKLVE